jgi:hypothetical protein
MSAKQTIVIEFLRAHSFMTLDQAVQIIGRNIYHNAHKHCGVLLANMVKRGMIVRVKPGVFRLSEVFR